MKTIEKADMRKFTTYKLKGTIDKVIFPENTMQLINVLKHFKENNIKHKIIGRGSNLIFLNDYHGVLIRLDKFDELKINDEVKVGAGYSLTKLALKTSKLGLSGLEFVCGIPGNVGGAIYMNAGAFGFEFKNVIKEIEVINGNLELETIKVEKSNFGYRDSLLKKNNFICVSATLKLKKSDEDLVKLIKEKNLIRKKRQPMAPSAGSVFKNPPGGYAGKIIEDLGLKGYKIGEAMVSNKHANFIINCGNATGKDIVALIEYIQKKVKDNCGIELILEQEIVE